MIEKWAVDCFLCVMTCFYFIMVLYRLYPSADHSRWGGHFQRSSPQRHRCHKLSHLQRSPMPGQLHSVTMPYTFICKSIMFKHLYNYLFFHIIIRMEGGARTQMPACISAAAPEDLQAAIANTTHPCTATQVHVNLQLTTETDQSTRMLPGNLSGCTIN